MSWEKEEAKSRHVDFQVRVESSTRKSWWCSSDDFLAVTIIGVKIYMQTICVPFENTKNGTEKLCGSLGTMLTRKALCILHSYGGKRQTENKHSKFVPSVYNAQG